MRQLKREEAGHRIYKIAAADLRDQSEAFAFAGRRKIAELAAASVESAGDAMRAQIDRRSEKFIENRVNGIPGPDKFADALDAALAKRQAQLESSLRAHCRFREAAAPIAETASRCGLGEEQVERDNLRFGRWLIAELPVEAVEASEAHRKVHPLASFAVLAQGKVRRRAGSFARNLLTPSARLDCVTRHEPSPL